MDQDRGRYLEEIAEVLQGAEISYDPLFENYNDQRLRYFRDLLVEFVKDGGGTPTNEVLVSIGARVLER